MCNISGCLGFDIVVSMPVDTFVAAATASLFVLALQGVHV
jgi:hypothetical protein